MAIKIYFWFQIQMQNNLKIFTPAKQMQMRASRQIFEAIMLKVEALNWIFALDIWSFYKKESLILITTIYSNSKCNDWIKDMQHLKETRPVSKTAQSGLLNF